MAMNLRLGPEAEEALRAEAQRTHRSQQDILRDAVNQYLGLGETRSGVPERAGRLRPPRSPYRRVEPSVDVPPGLDSLHLLDREDRL